MKDNYKLVHDFNKLTNDKDRWKFVLDNKDSFKVILDNDDTWVELIYDKKNEEGESLYGELNPFNNFIGWDDGLFDLFDALDVLVTAC